MSTAGQDHTDELFDFASRYLVAGVSGSARLNAATGRPLYLTHGDGCRVYDVDGREFIDYNTRRDLIDSLYRTLCRRYDELFALAAAPVEMALMGEGISGDVVSPQRFRDYVAPIYRRIRRAVAGTGKLTGAHMDGRLQALVKEIGEADLDISVAWQSASPKTPPSQPWSAA
jgi:hypothetical protein